MPFAVTHVIIPMILVDLVRDHVFKKQRKVLPNKFVLIAGIAGLLPDIDIPLSLLFMGNLDMHRSITHSIWFPIAFFALFLYFYFANKKPFLYKFFLMMFIGFSLHIFLDFTIFGTVNLMFPLSDMEYGMNVFPISDMYLVYSAVDSILLLGWLLHEELTHHISDFF